MQNQALRDKLAEEIVTEQRLRIIEKDHRSIGSILDNRHLFKLEEPHKLALKAASRQDAEQRTNSRRGAKNSQEIEKEATKALTELSKKGIRIVASGFETELLLWKTKASDPSYSIKRKQDNPELQKFRESLNSDQLKYFKDKTTDIVADLAQKLRDEFIVTKQAMDSTAVFHPEANAHRAHCLYMMKFYNSVISQNIEDVVLRQMQGGNDKPITPASSSNRQRDVTARLYTPKPAEKSIIKKNNSQKKLKKITNALSSDRLGLASGLQHTAGVDPLVATTNTHTKASESKVEEVQREEMDAMISTQDSSHLSSFNSLTHDKIFSKIKRGRMGATDPRQILLEEAARFDEAEVNYQRKISDKNSILDETVSEWMVQGIKEEQMGKIMQGTQAMPYNTSSKLDYSKTGNFSVANANPNYLLDNVDTKIIGFDDFYAMFNRLKAEEVGAAAVGSDTTTELERFSDNSTVGVGHHLNDPIDNNVTAQPALTSDLVHQFQETDPNFDVFYKTELLANEKKSIASKSAKFREIKARKIRNISIVGENAIVSTDLKNKSKNNNTGFDNYFKENNYESDEETEVVSVKDSHDIHRSDLDEDEGTIITNEDMDNVIPATTPSSPSATPAAATPSKSGRRRKGLKKKGATPGKADEVDQADTNQLLLVESWETLQVPTIQRLGFMRKYTTAPYSTMLKEAIYGWADIAVLVNIRLQLLKIAKIVAGGFYIISAGMHAFVDEMIGKIPEILRSQSRLLVRHSNDSLRGSMQREGNVIAMFVFIGSRHRIEHHVDQSSSMKVIVDISQWVDKTLVQFVSRIEENLGDVIPFGTNSSIKKWMESNPIVKQV